MALSRTTGLVAIALAPALSIGAAFYIHRPQSQSTDDAYVQADFTILAPQVSGPLAEVSVRENQAVQPGDLLARIDDRDFVVAVDAAKARVAAAEASIASLQAHLARQEAGIAQAQAAVAADDASLQRAREDQARYHNLSLDGSGTVQALQHADAQVSIESATRAKNLAGVQAARRQADVFKADLVSARAALAQARSAQSAAELKLSYTRITAPVAGVVGHQSARVGAFVNTGQSLLAIVPLDQLYVTANYRETQLALVRPGQAVDIEVDALPGRVLKGVVESIGPASGVSYSTVAPHNATGNFTKIVQRLPVRIFVQPGQPASANLRVGMSVKSTIRIGE